ncbi:hypothetical protein FNV43_RR00527 [Rhamnella rubrinervis]|uniref:Uncharacterized protein n=1 Tax=Rhamnella rubrinervis TaxID=2594499 RepID=A0A8K0MSH9_9ROSA|nr:hypothetical protein FNV43_RR00527 [Rhamnella rubrinervis]
MLGWIGLAVSVGVISWKLGWNGLDWMECWIGMKSLARLNKAKLINHSRIETDEPVMAANESSIDDLRYQIEGLGDQVVRIGEKISGVISYYGRSGTPEGYSSRWSRAAVGFSDRCRQYWELGYQDQYGHGKNGQEKIYVAGLNGQNGRNDYAAGQNGRQNLLMNLEAIDRLIEE